MMIYPLQVRPVLKRAGSVKQIGTAVLDSRVSTYAADRIDGALNVADKYVDKYLPSSASDQVDCKWRSRQFKVNKNDKKKKTAICWDARARLPITF